jgi:hypothetical protein
MVLYTEEWTPMILLPVFMIVPLIMPFFWKYHVTIKEDELSFGYSTRMTSKRATNRRKVIKEATPLFNQRWGGFGIHYRPDPNHSLSGPWERLYIASNGGAVKLLLGDKDDDEAETTTFYFSSRNPQKVCDILNGKAV